MTNFISFRNTGTSDEQALLTPMSRLLVQGAASNGTASSMQALQHAGGANMSVDVQIGDIMIPNTAGTYSYYGWSTAVNTVTIAAANATNPRIDTVVAYINMSVTNASDNSGALAFISVAGTAAGSPVAPSNSTIQAAVGAGNGWTPIANVAVAANATSIVTANITDTRYSWAVRADLWGGSNNTVGHNVPNVADDTVALLNATQTFTNKTLGTGSSVVTNGWQPASATFTYNANNGSKEFVVNTSTNLSSILSAGMKLQLTRGTTPPTQCFAFTATSSQYATASTVSGMTFSTAFTCEAWIYLNSYTGNPEGIIGRSDDTTGGFNLQIDASGRVRCYYGSSSSFTDFLSYQSIPLNQWTHVAVAVTSVSSKTASIYINGALVSSFSALTASAALTQTSNLTVGGIGAGISSRFFDGYISEARIWSVAQTQTSIRNNMGLNLSSTTNLVSLYQGNGVFTDGSGNANTLTSNNGALATQATNPYNAIEYFTILVVTSSTLTLDAGTMNTLPNMTLSTPFYSLESNPYGLPTNLRKYVRFIPIYASQSNQSTSPAYAPGLGQLLTIPTGTPRATITAYAPGLYNASAGFNAKMSIFSGASVGTLTTQLTYIYGVSTSGTSSAVGAAAIAVITPPSGSIAFSVGLSTSQASTTATMEASANAGPAFIKIEVDL